MNWKFWRRKKRPTIKAVVFKINGRVMLEASAEQLANMASYSGGRYRNVGFVHGAEVELEIRT
jgi:hypothetical protein